MTYYSETDWEQSSGPIISRKVHLSDQFSTQILWPEDGDFDTLTDGEHPLVALGPKVNRPYNITGVVMTYNSDTDTAVVNVADKFVSRQYVANILTYNGTAISDYQNSVQPFDPVYVDDSEAVAALNTGCTLTFSPLNDQGSANPLAGYVFWCQDEYADSGVGGANSTQDISQPAASDTGEALTLCIMQVNDAGKEDHSQE